MKAPDPACRRRATPNGISQLDVAIPGFRPCRLDPHRHQRIRLGREVAGRGQRTPQFRRTVDDMIGRHGHHQRVGTAGRNPFGRQRDAGCRVAADRLNEHMVRWNARQLPLRLGRLLAVGHDEHAFPGEQRQQPPHRLLQERPASGN